MATNILMLHYNDVYNVEPLAFKAKTDLAAGATRFAAKVKSFKAEDPLVLFSGDAFNPSSSESEIYVCILMANHHSRAQARPPPCD